MFSSSKFVSFVNSANFQRGSSCSELHASGELPVQGLGVQGFLACDLGAGQALQGSSLGFRV